ncbi:MAG: histidine phosphatase family protein [Lachnospiraceae bacterium]|nr:histidine phosphatase family protein [Lachnospiraceae bacterium]
MRIILVRHGDPNYEKDCLTPLGQLQAKAAAERLMEEGIEEIYSSPMGRARQTAQAFSELSGIQPVKILDFMHEISWGSTDENPIYRGGHPWDTVDAMARQNQDLTDRSWRENPYFKTNMATLENDRIAPKTDEWLSSLGYEREGFYYRCRRKDDSQHTVVLFCHGGSSTAMLAQILNLPFPYLCAAVHMNHTALTIIRLDARPGSLSAPVLELVSDDRHIRGITV